MVHNREKYTSINYVEYYQMNQERMLRERYQSEWNAYMTRMDDYNEETKRYNDAIRYNDEVDMWSRIEKETGNIYARYEALGQKAPLSKVKIPCMPSKPAYMEDPDTIDLYDYYDEEKYTKAWMLNVSPNWKGVVITREMIEFFEGVINEFYENCDRFTKMRYVLENGHGKDHLHAHIVFTLNTKKAGYMTSIKKGNILQEFRNIWNRLAKDNESLTGLYIDGEDYYIDVVGLLKNRCALNTCLLTTIGMYKDKIDYLDEDKKPTSHKNDEHPLCPIKGSKGYE